MNILLITQFYWPEVRTAPMNLAAVAEDLRSRGHQVTVITGFPNHPFGRLYDGYKMRVHEWEEVGGVRVLRLPLFPDHSASMVRRALNYGSFAASATLLGAHYGRDINYDVIFVYLPPLTVGLPVYWFGRHRQQAPIVYWMTDVWPEALLGSGAPVGGRLYRGIRRIEDWVYRQGAVICVNSPGYKTNLIEKDVPAAKVEVVVDWADEALFFPEVRDEDFLAAHGLDGKFNILYGGNLGPVQALDTVVEAAEMTQDLGDVQYVFVGDGTDLTRLQDLAAGRELSNVLFIPRQPANMMRRFFAGAGALLVHLKDEPLYRIQVPSKVMAYMACGRPVLCGVAGSAAEIVQSAGAGVFFEPENAASLAGAVRALLAMPTQEREAMGASGRRTYLEKYTRQIQVRRIESILENAVSAAGNGHGPH